MKILAKIIITTLSLLAIAYLVPGISVATFYTAFVVAIVFGILNIFVKPLIVFLTLPINILTFGLFTLILNAFLFWLASSFVSGFVVSGALPAFMGALVLSVLKWFGDKLIG